MGRGEDGEVFAAYDEVVHSTGIVISLARSRSRSKEFRGA